VSRRLRKVAIVTGAGTELEKRLPTSLLKEGASVIVNGLPDDPIEDVAKSIEQYGGSKAKHAGDVSQEFTPTAPHRHLTDSCDILVNNAGFSALAETQDHPVEVFDDTIRMNLRSAFLMTKYALPHLQKIHGNIVSAGSEAGFNDWHTTRALRRTKGWMHSFRRVSLSEQVKYCVRANCPGLIDTLDP